MELIKQISFKNFSIVQCAHANNIYTKKFFLNFLTIKCKTLEIQIF